MTDHLLEVLAKLAGLAVATATLYTLGWKGVRAMIRTVRKLGRLADEVLGDGDERPGWGARLTALEKKVSTVLGEVRPNGGGSLKDQITRIEEATGATRDTP